MITQFKKTIMQNHQTLNFCTKNLDYVSIVQKACDQVAGFSELYRDLEQSISINGKSQSALTNYSRQLAHLALYYNCMPLDLDADQVIDYLYHIKSSGTTSPSFFNFTIHGMRYACKMRGMEYKQFSLPCIRSPKKLPVVLNGSEVKALLSVCSLLKHKLIIGLLYGCGLRSSEVQNLKPADIDLEREMLHIHQGKGSKDRCLPLGKMLCRGIGRYLTEAVPGDYVFENKTGEPLTGAGIAWIVKQAAKKARISKDVHPHTLRHSYATCLLEKGVNILIIKELLGHAYIESTMVYLHVAKPTVQMTLWPLDILYEQC
jgi:site-specific recombinase XerD